MVCATSRKKAVHPSKALAALATPWAASNAASTSPATTAHSSASWDHPCLCALTAARPRKRLMQQRLQRPKKKPKLNSWHPQKSGSLSRFFIGTYTTVKLIQFNSLQNHLMFKSIVMLLSITLITACASIDDIDTSKVNPACGQTCTFAYSSCVNTQTIFPIQQQHQCAGSLRLCVKSCPAR